MSTQKSCHECATDFAHTPDDIYHDGWAYAIWDAVTCPHCGTSNPISGTFRGSNVWFNRLSPR